MVADNYQFPVLFINKYYALMDQLYLYLAYDPKIMVHLKTNCSTINKQVVAILFNLENPLWEFCYFFAEFVIQRLLVGRLLLLV